MQAVFEIWLMFIMVSSIFATEDAGNDTGVSTRIIGGVITEHGEFKFVVGLRVDKKRHTTLMCTGTVLNQHTVLTAGHCVDGFKRITVYVNCNNLVGCTNTRAGTGFIHPQYEHVRSMIVNDIGVVKTTQAIGAEEVTLQEHPAPMYPTCTVVGYGATSKDSYTVNMFLHKAAMKEIVWCASIYPEDKRYRNALCCFVEDGPQPYVGDSGGPLLCNKTQVGVCSQQLSRWFNGKKVMIIWTIPKINTNYTYACGSLHLISIFVLALTLLSAHIHS